MYKKLWSKGRIGELELQNRFVMPPMDTSLTGEDGTVTDELIAYYSARAKGGFGLIITEYTCVDPEGKANPTQLSAYDDCFIPGLTKLAEEIHKYDSKLFVQLQHSGKETTSDITGKQPVSASAVISSYPGREQPRELSSDEIKQIVNRFGDAALRVKKSGADGVEVQAGHGYLLAQFLSGLSNKRTDEYGGDIVSRSKIVKEVIANIKGKCGSEFPISVRISGEEYMNGGLSIQDTTLIAKEIEKAGADAIHASAGTVSSAKWLIAPACVPRGFNISAAEKIKKAVEIPVITVGRINEPELAEFALENDCADFVALGRASIADPEFPNKVRDGRIEEIAPCVACLSRCFYNEGAIPGDFALSCMLNPFTGHEKSLKLEKTDHPRSVIVVGGGPGGLEAAWTAAAVGHNVTLFEKESVYGGQLLAAAISPGKYEMTRAIKYLVSMCNKYGVKMQLGKEATLEEIKKMQPDKVILATGAKPVKCPINTNGLKEIAAVDVLLGNDTVGKSALIIGGGMVGLETASFLASLGKRVTVVEMQNNVGNDINASVKSFLMKELEDNKVEIFTSTAVKKFGQNEALCEKNGEEIRIRGIDTIVTAIGSRAFNLLESPLKENGIECVVIGDAKRARKAAYSIEEAVRAVVAL